MGFQSVRGLIGRVTPELLAQGLPQQRLRATTGSGPARLQEEAQDRGFLLGQPHCPAGMAAG